MQVYSLELLGLGLTFCSHRIGGILNLSGTYVLVTSPNNWLVGKRLLILGIQFSIALCMLSCVIGPNWWPVVSSNRGSAKTFMRFRGKDIRLLRVTSDPSSIACLSLGKTLGSGFVLGFSSSPFCVILRVLKYSRKVIYGIYLSSHAFQFSICFQTQNVIVKID